jgi:uncharacterized protein (TIGR00251 family)
MISLRETETGTSFAVRVQPRASRTAVAGILGEGDNAALKIALAAPPVDGQANEALIRFLAELFAVSRAAVVITAGAQSRNKTVRIAGIGAEYIQMRLAEAHHEK